MKETLRLLLLLQYMTRINLQCSFNRPKQRKRNMHSYSKKCLKIKKWRKKNNSKVLMIKMLMFYNLQTCNPFMQREICYGFTNQVNGCGVLKYLRKRLVGYLYYHMVTMVLQFKRLSMVCILLNHKIFLIRKVALWHYL